MAKKSHFDGLLSEIELLLAAGKEQDARVLLTFLDEIPPERKDRLRLALIHILLGSAGDYDRQEIARIAAAPDLSPVERSLIEKFSLHIRGTSGQTDGAAPISADGGEPPLSDSAPSRAVDAAEREESERAGDFATSDAPGAATIRSLEQDLQAKNDLLSRRYAEIAALEARVVELAEQNMDLGRVAKQERCRWQEEKAQISERLHSSEAALAASEERSSERIGALELELATTRELLAAGHTELEALKAELTSVKAENAERAKEKQQCERELLQRIGEQTALMRLMESSMLEMEQQMGTQIRLLQAELDKKQELLQHQRVELDELRRQAGAANQGRGETDFAASAENGEGAGGRLLRSFFALRHRSDGARSLKKIFLRARVSLWLKVRPPWNSGEMSQPGDAARRRPAKTLSVSQLAAVAAGLLLLPAGYFAFDFGRNSSRGGEPAEWGVDSQAPGSMPPTSVAQFDGMSAAPANSADGDAAAAAPGNRSAAPQGDRRVQGRAKADGERNPGYVTRRAVLLREWPRYAANAKEEIGPGTRVTVLDSEGSWLRVKTYRSGSIGYVRKEYLVQSRAAH